MAVVLNAMVPYLINMIKDIPEEEVRILLGVSGEIKKLGNKVENLEAYVTDAERRRIDDARVQRWVNKLKGAMYEAIDALELCQLDAKDARHSRGVFWTSMEEKAPGCLKPLLFCLLNPIFAHGMGKRLKELNARLDGIRKEMDEFRFEPLVSYELQKVPSDVTPSSRMTTSFLDESNVVGEAIKADTKSLVQVLLTNQSAIMVVSIVGAGGMGKSTLAKRIFNDETIQVEFRTKIWLSVTESYEEEKLLSSAITQAGGEPRGDKQNLTQILASILSTGKFLLVLDDVWSDRPWSSILQSPAVHAAHNHQPGSRVIITSRNEGIVRQMGLIYYPHHVKPMSDEDAWSLLKGQLLTQDVGSESDLDQLKHIGKGIIEKCDGLPLAIKAVGGLLRTKKANKREWKGVLNDPAWLTDKTHHDLNAALRLSYEDLSPSLKQCFLYCSLFPKGEISPAPMFIGMWMSEGFLQVQPGDEGRSKEPEDIGTCYYTDLITRNLMEPFEGDALRRSSGMHDVIRSFAQYMAKEEAAVFRVGEISPLISLTKFRRLAIESTASELDSVALPEWNSIFGKQELLRSLIISSKIKFDPSTDSSLSRFPSLRALRLMKVESERFIESLCKLKHLRFLCLVDTDITRLPDDIDKMKFLQYFLIGHCANFSGQLPSGILKLEHLRYLVLAQTKFIVPKGLCALTNLRTLGIFPVQVDGEWCSLQELGPLSQLRELLLIGLAAVPSSLLAEKAKIHDKEQLRGLSLCCNDCYEPFAEVVRYDEKCQEDCTRVEKVFDQLCPPPLLESLAISDYIGEQAPSWMCMNAGASFVDLNSLTNLHMMGLPFCTQLPDGLCRLLSLEVLLIDFAPAIRRVGPEFQRQTGSSLARLSFPRLKILRLKGLPEWEEWEWEEEAEAKAIAMPALQTLILYQCKLDLLPAGLASSWRFALRVLYLYDLSIITVVENFPSVVELAVVGCPRLKTIRGFTKLLSVSIVSCPALEVLEGGPALDTMELVDPAMETLPEYFKGLKPRILILKIHKKLHDIILSDSHDSAVERAKLKHCGKVNVSYSQSSSHQHQALQVVPHQFQKPAVTNQHSVRSRSLYGGPVVDRMAKFHDL